MTPTPDWADELAMAWKGGEVARAKLAADFRKVKAAGLREAAEIAEGHFIYGHSVAGPHFAAAGAAKILAAAEKLEAGN